MELLPAYGPPSRISGIARLSAALLGIVLLSQPNLADAADGKGGDTTTIAVVRGPTSDVREMPEVSSGGGVVLRGNRPVNPSQPARDQGGEATNVGFSPRTFLGSGWDTGYDFNGLNYVPTPR